MEKAVVSIFLDKRRIKANGKYPAKLRVYYKDDERRLYDIKTDLTAEEYEKAYEAKKVKSEYADIKRRLYEIEDRANKIIDSLTIFSFELFAHKMFRKATDANNIVYHYEQYIQRLRQEEKIGTADSYQQSLNSLRKFVKDSTGKDTGYIPFEGVSPAFLLKYEKWMLKESRSRTTVGIYLRPLRSVFNAAIADEEISKASYPFGKRKYQIPAGKKTKKALNMNELQKLYCHEIPVGHPQQKARTFFFFIYQSSGLNVADIAEMKYANIVNGILTFYRAKTIDTTKGDSKPIVVALTDKALEIIKDYGNVNVGPDTYVFPILTHDLTATQKKRKIKGFIKNMNDHLKNIAKACGITESISSNWARHSFASNAIRNGVSMEYVQESLGHNSISTTQNYFAGFEENTKKAINEALMDFSKLPKDE